MAKFIRLGVVARQAAKNSVSILWGTIAGAVNTLIVLPLAFISFPEGWGIIKVLTAWALILAQFLHGGAPNMWVRFYPQFGISDQKKLLGLGSLFTLAGSLLLGIALLSGGHQLIGWLSPEDGELLKGYLVQLFVLCVAMSMFYTLNGFVSVRLKTTVYQFLNEAFLKTWYLLITLAFLWDWVSFNELIWWYVGGYVIAFAVLLAYSVAQGFKPKIGGWPADWKTLSSYSPFSILDRGAGIIVNNLDIIMIGALIGLDNVAFYTLAFYIGAVVMLPQKSLMAVANPVVSHAIAQDDEKGIKDIYVRSSLMQLLVGGLMFMAIWVSIDEVMALLPPQFGNGKWVVFYIGLSRLFQMATGVSGGIIVYSKHYRQNFYLNLVLIALTILTNWLFISPKGLDLGMDGAALATALSFFIYNLVKLIMVQRLFKMNPITSKWVLTILLVAVMCLAVVWHPLPQHPFCAIILKSSLACIVFLLLTKAMNLSPELEEMLRNPRKLLQR